MNNKTPAIVMHTAPSTEPLTVAEVKIYLRIDGEAENDLISSMIISARIAAEKYMRNSLISQQWKLSFDDFAPQEIRLPYGPVTSIDSVNLYDEQNNQTVFDAANYYLTAGNLALYFKQIPSAQRIEIIYNTGFGETAEDVPNLIKQGLLAHIAYLYERKIPAGEVSETAKFIYNVYRNVNL